MTRKYFLNVFLFCAFTTLLVSCYPTESIPISDLDTTSTFYTPEDFKPAPKVAALIWDVAQIENDDDNDLPYDGEVDDEILNTTLVNLVELYGEDNVYIIAPNSTLVPTPANPNVTVVLPINIPSSVDITIAPSIILRKNFVGIIHPGYPWWPGGGWWGPCWYCGYPPYVSYQKYESGTVILDMVNIKKYPIGSSDVEPSWVAINRGLLSSNNSFNADRVVEGINQSFVQSPYLN